MTVTNPFTDTSVTTSDATVTTVQEQATTTDLPLGLTVDITAVDGANQDVGAWSQKILFSNDAGVVSQIGKLKNIFRQREDLDWEVTYEISGDTVQIRVQGEAGKTITWNCRTQKTPPAASEPTGTHRTTGGEVKQIFETDLTASEVTEFITIANLIITEVLGSSSLSSDTLTEIERWLTAHFASAWDQRLVSEKIGDSAVVYQYVKEKGIKSTDYGQRAMLLDTTGLLARLGGPKATFFTSGVSIT